MEALERRDGRLFFHQRLADGRLRRLAAAFAAGRPATEGAAEAGVSRNTANRYFRLFRLRLAAECESAGKLGGPAELGALRLGGQRGAELTAVVAARLDGAEVRAVAADGLWRASVAAALPRLLLPGAEVRAGPWADAELLRRLGFLPASRVWQSRAAPARFAEFCRARLAPLRGMPRQSFPLHLKEWEFRFNAHSPAAVAAALLNRAV